MVFSKLNPVPKVVPERWLYRCFGEMKHLRNVAAEEEGGSYKVTMVERNGRLPGGTTPVDLSNWPAALLGFLTNRQKSMVFRIRF